MSRIMKGIIHVTGEHDTGKTSFALEQGAQPEKIAMFDDDIKGRATVEEFRERLKDSGRDFGTYYDLVSLRRKERKLVDFHKACMEIVNGIKPNQFDVIVWDTWTIFSQTCGVYVKANPSEFRNPKEWSSMGRIKGAEMNKEGTLYEATIIGQLSELAPTVILVTHLKDQYLNDGKTGKLIPASSKTLNRVPRMRVWLRQNPNGCPVPIGLFLKRFDKKIVTDDGIRTICVVPRKITPLDNESSLWDTIWRYWDEPVGNRTPLPEETPNEFELSILDGTLTQDQKRTFELMLQAGVITPPEPESTFAAPKVDTDAEIRRLHSEGKTLEQIAEKLGKPLPPIRSKMKRLELS